jgi:hypothetical protein
MRLTTRDLIDPLGLLLALFCGLCVYLIQGRELSWIPIGAAAAVLTVKLGSQVVLTREETRRTIPNLPLPELTQKEANVAFGIWRGMTDSEISAQINLPISRVEGRVQRIAGKWGTKSRGQIRQRMIEMFGEPPRKKQRWEWIAELALGVATFFGGVGVLIAPTGSLIGPYRDYIGLGLAAIGLLFCVISTSAYVRERNPPR